MANRYNDAHRLFVQGMFTKRIVTEAEANQFYNHVHTITTRTPDNEYPMFVAAINKELNELDYSLRMTQDERDGEPYLVLVNVKQDAMTEGATMFKPLEISYCRELFDAIVNADNEDFAVTTMGAINLGSKIKPLKLNQRETQEVLDQLVLDGWIGLERKGVYYLATRGLTELQGFLREQYGDIIRDCVICLDIVTMGESCAVSNCPIRMHKHCANTQFRNSTNPVCPQCSARWSRNNTFGLGLPDDDDEE
ncbi:Nse1 non-SMC component of SMC5-6 complex-domain-containing protein [Mucor mucedo]|uniref:Nse1 non-SMC component of SMC5-6 complex-domain-containing protein n=1 Tax=Mucor mucedo TaxID=29922 RepID=UPI002220B9C7|nr:Nse1 non-SMC component of SMC5-6 complex-domain-containing protein [Mucor mucedo]KAI7884491.1 Nse1 non-SMC component of SMC5-6 complex-domain-containing protein [Mucor mucedo]